MLCDFDSYLATRQRQCLSDPTLVESVHAISLISPSECGVSSRTGGHVGGSCSELSNHCSNRRDRCCRWPGTEHVWLVRERCRCSARLRDVLAFVCRAVKQSPRARLTSAVDSHPLSSADTSPLYPPQTNFTPLHLNRQRRPCTRQPAIRRAKPGT